MILILIAIIFCGVFAAFLISKGEDSDSVFTMSLGIFLAIATAITAVSYCYTIWSWKASQYKADIINQEYGKNYTAEQIFYAKDVIETIRQMDRQRIEVNGNIMGNNK